MSNDLKRRVKAPEVPKDERGRYCITKDFLKKQCESQGGYSTPRLNDSLHLSSKGFSKIEELEDYFAIKTIYLDSNNFNKIENLEKLTDLRCLFLQSNLIERIENLDELTLLDTLNLSNNKISKVEGLSNQLVLTNLDLSSNLLKSVESLQGLAEIPSLVSVNLSSNQIEGSEESLISLFSSMPNLRCLSLKGNPIVNKIKLIRKKMVSNLKSLTYLDDRPVTSEERRAAEAWLVGGEENEQREKQLIATERENKQRDYLLKVSETRNSLRFKKVKELAQLKENINNQIIELSKEQEQKNSASSEEETSSEFYKRALSNQIEAFQHQIELIDGRIDHINKGGSMQVEVNYNCVSTTDVLPEFATQNNANRQEVVPPFREDTDDSLQRIEVSSHQEGSQANFSDLIKPSEEMSEKACEDSQHGECVSVDTGSVGIGELKEILDRYEFDFAKAKDDLKERGTEMTVEDLRRIWTEHEFAKGQTWIDTLD